MTDLDPTDDVHCAAVHEAGHAVAGFRFGLTLVALHIDPGPATCPGKCEFDENANPSGLDMWGVARVDLATTRAGMVAEEIFSGRSQHDVCEGDLEWSTSIVDGMIQEDAAFDGDAQIARTDAYLSVSFTHASWHAVQLIAEELVLYHHLDPIRVMEELTELLGPPKAGLDPASPSGEVQ